MVVVMLKKTNKEFKIIEKKEKGVFTIKSKNSDKITIYEKTLVNNIFNNKFNEQYKKLFMITTSVCESDDYLLPGKSSDRYLEDRQSSVDHEGETEDQVSQGELDVHRVHGDQEPERS